MFDVEEALRRALREDIGAGDLTSEAVVPADARARGEFVAKEDGVVAGLPFAGRVFALLEPDAGFEQCVSEGAPVARGEVMARVTAGARTVLSGERTALNLVQRLSGIATATAKVVALLEGSQTRVLDTRKTTPGLRALEKYAVRVGGGTNHRSGLYDAVLIKNNHLKFAAPSEAIRRARAHAPATASVEIEVETLEQLEDALSASPDIVMLDNMSVEMMRRAVEIVHKRARIEVSGNVTAETIPQLRDLGVDYVSMGALTHSARALDISLRVTFLG